MSILKTIYLQHLNGANANMTLDSSGRVGIGNNSPSYPLHVAGEIFSGRSDSSAEGGQISLGRASDNALHYYIDCYGGSTTPSMRFVDGSAGAVRMSIDSSGRVTMPYQPAFYAYGGAFGPGSITFNTTDFNIGSHYSTSTGRFTAPIAGVYQFGFQMFIQSSGATQCNIQKNGASVAECKINTSEGAYNSYSCNILISLAASDYMNIGVGAGSDGKALVGHDYTFFWGRLTQ